MRTMQWCGNCSTVDILNVSHELVILKKRFGGFTPIAAELSHKVMLQITLWLIRVKLVTKRTLR